MLLLRFPSINDILNSSFLLLRFDILDDPGIFPIDLFYLQSGCVSEIRFRAGDLKFGFWDLLHFDTQITQQSFEITRVDRFRSRKSNEKIRNIGIVLRKCLLGIGQIFMYSMDFVCVTFLESTDCFRAF